MPSRSPSRSPSEVLARLNRLERRLATIAHDLETLDKVVFRQMRPRRPRASRSPSTAK